MPVVSCCHLNSLTCDSRWSTLSYHNIAPQLRHLFEAICTGSHAGHKRLISERAMADGLTAGGVQRLRDGVEDEPLCLRVRAACSLPTGRAQQAAHVSRLRFPDSRRDLTHVAPRYQRWRA